ncbi:MAG: group 1 truncated hemoglobin [Candidatus Methylomirabilales bacterium]|jgi:hemoglobin|nr:group 1 truncated hemoglobin [candidate division NC10 bacterium]
MPAQRVFLKTFGLLFALVLGMLWIGMPTIAKEKPKPSLYDRLGGIYPIATVVDTFIELLLVNDTLNANPAIKEARDRVPKAGLKYRVTALVCQVSGGPCQYTGRSMKETHAQMYITEREWQAMAADFRRTLNNYQVPAQEQKELIAIVESTKKDIVIPTVQKKRKKYY